MKQVEQWMHFPKSVLKCGRITLIDEEAPEGMEPEEFAIKRQAMDPSEPRLKPIIQDAKVKGNAAAWSIRCYGDMTEYQASNPTVSKQSFGCVIVKSNTWPGACTFFT